MGFLSPLRRLFTYLMSLHTPDNVVPPMNHLLFGTPATGRSYPMDADIYHVEFLKFVQYSEVDLTLQSCVTRVELCKEKKNLEHECLVAHVVYWFDGQPHNCYKSYAVIGRSVNGKGISPDRTQQSSSPALLTTGAASPSAAPPPPASGTSSSVYPLSTPPAVSGSDSPSPSRQGSRNPLSKRPDDIMNIYYRDRPSDTEVCASMDFDPSVPGNLLPFERLTCMQSVASTFAESYNIIDKNCYWYASWIWDALLLSKDLSPSVDDGFPRSLSVGGIDIFGMRVRTIRNTGEKHPCGALVRSHNAVQQMHVDKCDAHWATFQARVKATMEEAIERRTGLEREKARADEAVAHAAEEARARAAAETRATEEARARAEAETRAAQEATRAANLQAELERLRKLMESQSPIKSSI